MSKTPKATSKTPQATNAPGEDAFQAGIRPRLGRSPCTPQA